MKTAIRLMTLLMALMMALMMAAGCTADPDESSVSDDSEISASGTDEQETTTMPTATENTTAATSTEAESTDSTDSTGTAGTTDTTATAGTTGSTGGTASRTGTTTVSSSKSTKTTTSATKNSSTKQPTTSGPRVSSRVPAPTGGGEGSYVYKIVKKQVLQLTFLPPHTKVYDKAPLYFLIPGGGWSGESRQGMIDFSARSASALRLKGFAVVSIDYRVTKDGVTVMRDIIADCFDALTYMAYYADLFGIDPQRIAVSGHSAGGHLALMTAYADPALFAQDGYPLKAKFHIMAAAPMSPPTVMYRTGVPKTLGFDVPEAYRGCNTEEERRLTSPLTHVSADDPPTLLAVGTEDNLVLPISSELVAEKLKACKVDCRMVYSVGGGHSFETVDSAHPATPNAHGVLDEVTAFILEVLAKS